MNVYTCNFCATPLVLVHDFGKQPLANRLSSSESMVVSYPLRLFHCTKCDLAQTKTDQTFLFDDDYPYQSSINESYVKQCEEFYSSAIGEQNKDKVIVEIGCNDGYLLQALHKKGFTNLHGFEPVKHLATKAGRYGNVVNDFFNLSTFGRVPRADYIILNNVFAHTPKINEMLEALRLLSYEKTKIYVEVQDFEELVLQNAWDTIYHEHLSYFTESSFFNVVSKYFRVDHITDLQSHGKSKRYLLTPKIIADYTVNFRKSSIDYQAFSKNITFSKVQSLYTLTTLKKVERKNLILFGAAAKGITWVNYLGLDSDTFSFCLDETPTKLGKLMPKSNIDITNDLSKVSPSDIVIILAWNFKNDIKKKLPNNLCLTKNSDGTFTECTI